jgi:serine/threonine protein kinase
MAVPHLARNRAGWNGVVYEAMDERLDRRIAIKCAKTGFRKRCLRKCATREITHPNVCKIFEIHTARTQAGEIDFVSMEYLEGETLADRLKRGPLPKRSSRHRPAALLRAGGSA